MSSNKNLFYSLYSKSNNVVSAGYTCTSAIDEADTSFDITTNSTGGSAGTITDSNGNKLSSIDLSSIHVDGITQYNSETRILQPHSCYVLQGQEYGLACAEYYYVIPKHVSDTKGYEYYISCDFDVIYNNFAPKKYHVSTIHTDADGHTSFTNQINKQLKKFNIEVAASLIKEYDEVDKKEHQYLKFMAQKEGYFYYINNLRITLHFQSEDYPYSPFKKEISELKPYIYDLIKEYHPVQITDPEYDPETYEVNCDLYSWIIYNYLNAIEHLEDSFDAMIFDLQQAVDNPEDADYWIHEANIIIQTTAYDSDIFNNYDLENIKIIRNIIAEIKEKQTDIDNYYKEVYWLREDRHRRIPLMKYPNGAFRGIVMVPDWPDDNTEYSSLWINHIKSTVTLYVPYKHRQYVPKVFGVLSNATLVREEKDFRHKYRDFGIMGLENSTTDVPDGWDEGDDNYPTQPNFGPNDINTDYLDPYRPDREVADDLAWMGQNYYSRKNNIIGIFRYMQYVNDNKLWDKAGEAYMIIGNEDNVQSHVFNLPTSLLVYNPNDVPIRIKFMTFS